MTTQPDDDFVAQFTGKLDANNEAAYQAAKLELSALLSDSATYDSVFEIGVGLQKSVLQYIQEKLRLQRFQAEIKFKDGATDWSAGRSFLSVKAPPRKGTVVAANDDFSIYDCHNK